MSTRPLVAAGALALALALSLAPASASADAKHSEHGHGRDFTFAVIGDIPYGDAEIAGFPQAIAQINADPDVQFVDHLGDIKNGSSACSDAYFSLIKSDFDLFRDPLVYTVGDNEWTDCHRPNNGAYNPLERLTAIRKAFFDHPGRTLGQHSVKVASDAAAGYPENVRYTRGDVAFAALHVVGSNNSLAPWTGNTTSTPEQTAEVLGRTASVINTIHETFASARHDHDRAVALMLQADMFDPTVTNAAFADYYAFQPIIAAIAQESAAFDKPVYLFNGDSHVYTDDRPLASGSKWLDFYHVPPAPNLQRVTIDGSADATNYLKVTVNPRGRSVLNWTRIPYTG